MPVGVLTALLGLEAIGPATYIVLALASVILLGNPRNGLMPYLVTGLKLVDHADRGAAATPGRVWRWLGMMIVAGLTYSRLRADRRRRRGSVAVRRLAAAPGDLPRLGADPSVQLAASFFVGWTLKTSVVHLFGASGYRRVLPIVVAVITRELLAATDGP